MFSRLVLALLAAALLTACTPEQASAPRQAATPAAVERPIGRYVALGDSYTAAPYVGVTALENGCLRSEENYPALLARRIDVRVLVDVSCAGAETRHLLEPQDPFVGDAAVPPQLDAVTPDTDLVTIGIGGNDEGLFRRMFGRHDLGDTTDVETDLGTIGDNLARAVRSIREKAPDATVVVVGYPRLAGARACPQLPVARELLPVVDRMTRLLRDHMRTAARDNGALFVDLYRPSAGHAVCSAEPWVNGIRSEPMRGLALHPLAAGQDATARLLKRLLLD